MEAVTERGNEMKNESIYEMVTNKIIEKLENGVIPWRKPWKNGGPVNSGYSKSLSRY